MAIAEVEVEHRKAPGDQAGVAEAVRAAYEARTPIYPLGGATALNYGCSPSLPGRTLDLSGLDSIVDYTPRDMTIVVEAGVRMADLAATLAEEGQHLPIDVPRAKEATIGGVVATNWTGPRRCGHGTVRDYVIGINAVDGRGVAFKGGGRVVKNVAGYDFCKLLTGSLGTLAVITQVALKVKPLPETAEVVVATCPSLLIADECLASLVSLEAVPAVVDVLAGGDSKSSRVAVRVEGTAEETRWLVERLQSMFQQAGASNTKMLTNSEAARLWDEQVAFADGNSPLLVRIAVPPSAVTRVIADVLAIDSQCEIQSHAADGIVFARFSKFSQAELSSVLVGKLRPEAIRHGGSAVVVRSKLEGLTPHLVWGGRTDALVLLERIKEKLDPHRILNPGRFVL